MNHAFNVIPLAEQPAFHARYLDYLHQRDGKIDRARRWLSRREALMGEIDADPVRVEGRSPVDQVVFDRNLHAPAPEPGLAGETLLAVAMVKACQNENYGVEQALKRGKGGSEGPLDEHLAYLLVEETYHTRMIVFALRALGVTADIRPPGMGMRALLDVMAWLPPYAADPLALCGELAGVVGFRVLLEQARARLGGAPRARACAERMLGGILVDEAGHVLFLRSRLDPPRMALARALYPVVCWSLMRDVPELGALVGHDSMWKRFLDADVQGAVGEFPERFSSPGVS